MKSQFRPMQYPQRFLRVTRILFGALEVIDESLTLPISTLELSFFTPNGRFSLFDPRGAYKMFQWKQEIDAGKSIESVKIPLGPFYLQEAEGTVDASTKLSCVNIIGILDALEYMGGLYDKMLVSALLTDILTPEGIAFVLDPAFATTTVTGHLPIGSKRAALAAYCFCHRGGCRSNAWGGRALFSCAQVGCCYHYTRAQNPRA